MCGIAGIIDLNKKPSVKKDVLVNMIKKIEHRGPDGYGYYCQDYIGLAHARLSIIDLITGSQPIHNEDESVWCIFNGEIFNYIELTSKLKKLGHNFYTKTDTEVIVHLYEEYGENFVDHINGQFAISLWDKRNEKLILVRDRAGILPLYYGIRDNKLIFASEIKSILPAFNAPPELNPFSLDQIMTFWMPISPNTVFKDIFEVSPGEMLIIQNGAINRKKYWKWNYPDDGNYRSGSIKSISEELLDILVDATLLRLRSDVPVGAYLSGGLDSSALVSIIHNFSNASLRTFSISFEESSLDESNYQQLVKEYLNIDHSNIHCHTQDVFDGFLSTIWHTEAPILRTAPVPMKILSQFVRKNGYKVVITGEGADEILGGYDIFKEAKVRQFWAKNKSSGMRPALLKRLYPYLALPQAEAYLYKFFGDGLSDASNPLFSHMPRWTTTARCKEFFSKNIRDQIVEDAIDVVEKNLPGDIERWHTFNRAQYIEANTLMPGYLLNSQGDRMLMSNSVEGRFPYLDHRLIEFCNSLHPNTKMKVLNEKYILKEAVKNYLPAEIINRYKQPYRGPSKPPLFNHGEHDYVDELMDPGLIDKYGYFDSGKVKRLKGKIDKGRVIGNSDSMAYIGILSTQAWHHLFIENFDTSA